MISQITLEGRGCDVDLSKFPFFKSLSETSQRVKGRWRKMSQEITIEWTDPIGSGFRWERPREIRKSEAAENSCTNISNPQSVARVVAGF
jgi:hypothetical protein